MLRIPGRWENRHCRVARKPKTGNQKPATGKFFRVRLVIGSVGSRVHLRRVGARGLQILESGNPALEQPRILKGEPGDWKPGTGDWELREKMVVGEGFEPSKGVSPADLQSAPIDHSGILPRMRPVTGGRK